MQVSNRYQITMATHLHAMHLPDVSTCDELRHKANTQRHHETVEPASAAAAAAAGSLDVYVSDTQSLTCKGLD